MMLSVLGGLLGAIPEVFKLGQGLKQVKQGNKGLDGLTRPEYSMPEEAARALGIAQGRYADKFMPGEGVYTDRIEQQGANAYAQGAEAGNPFALIGNIHAQSSNQLQDLQTKSAQFQLQNENAYKQQLMTTADYRDQEWQMNEFAPYKDKYTEFRDMIGAGNKNIYGGLDSLSAIGQGILGSFGQSFGMGKSVGASPIDGNRINSIVSGYNGGFSGNNGSGNYGTGGGNQDPQITPGYGIDSSQLFGSFNSSKLPW